MSDPNTNAPPSVAAIPDFAMSLLRQAATAAAVALLAHVPLIPNTDDNQKTIVGVILLAVAAGWSYLSKRLAAKKLQDAVAAPAGLTKPPGT